MLHCPCTGARVTCNRRLMEQTPSEDGVFSLHVERKAEREREREREKLSLFRWHIFATNRLLSRVSQLSPLSRRVQESTKEHLMTRLTRGFVPPTSLLFTSQLPSSPRYPLLTTEYRYTLSFSFSLSVGTLRVSPIFSHFREWSALPLNDFRDISSRKVVAVREISVACSGY